MQLDLSMWLAINNVAQLNTDKIKAEYEESLKETCKVFQNLIAKDNLEFFQEVTCSTCCTLFWKNTLFYQVKYKLL